MQVNADLVSSHIRAKHDSIAANVLDSPEPSVTLLTALMNRAIAVQQLKQISLNHATVATLFLSSFN
jgi:hypothetical protein